MTGDDIIYEHAEVFGFGETEAEACAEMGRGLLALAAEKSGHSLIIRSHDLVEERDFEADKPKFLARVRFMASDKKIIAKPEEAETFPISSLQARKTAE